MSWDLFVFSHDTPMNTDQDGAVLFADDFEPRPLGSLVAVRAKLSDVFPAIDWVDPTLGSLDASEYSLEFSVGDEDPCVTLTIHARGAATPAILRLIGATGWPVLDTMTGRWVNLSADPDAGRRSFETYLKSVLSPGPAHQDPLEPKERRGLLSRIFGR